MRSVELGHHQHHEPQPLHILAVDDSLVDRKVIEQLLKISCCKVTSVESGTRALEYLGLDGDKRSLDLQVNLIMTDYSMPGMTGYELLKKIKGSSACQGIPVVIMSSENVLTRINRCLEEGAKDFLMKPVKLSDVKRLRDCIMQGEYNVSEKQQKALPLLPSTSLMSCIPALSSSKQSSTSSPPALPSCPATALKPSPPLFASSDLSCSLQHLSSPPSSPHWPSKDQDCSTVTNSNECAAFCCI